MPGHKISWLLEMDDLNKSIIIDSTLLDIHYHHIIMTNYHSITIPTATAQHEQDNLIHDHDIDHFYNPHPQDHLTPPFHTPNNNNTSKDRPATLLIGTFNLIATILGGGVLTLPIAFQKCGITITTIFMLISAIMTHMSLLMLCYASRRSGASSFGEVVRCAYGERAEVGVNVLLFVYISFVVAAFMVLIRDIWTPLVGMMLGSGGGTMAEGEEEGGVNGDQVLMAFMIFLLPFLFQRTLHALKWNCYIGFASIIVLCSALVRGGFQRQYGGNVAGMDDVEEDEDDGIYDIEWFKIPPAKDALFAFPIIMLAFLCQFNILSIQNTLERPTRKRMSQVVGFSVGASMVLMYLFGLGGYMMYGSDIQGNVLLNISVNKDDYADESLYWLFLLGRIGCGTTLVLALPLSFLPGRDALLEIIDVWFHHQTNPPAEAVEHNQVCLKVLQRCNYTYETPPNAQDVTDELEIDEVETQSLDNTVTRKTTILIRDQPIQQDYVFRNSMLHYGSTLVIVTYCFIGATRVAGVATIWSLVGSSFGFFIAFILPFASFIVVERGVVERGDRLDSWIGYAKVMLIASILGAVFCTWNRLSSPVA